MGMFKKSTASAGPAPTSPPTSAPTIDMRKETATVSLVKALQVSLDKGVDLGEISAQVFLAVDFSYSMNGRYRNGEVQATVERALALALGGLDDDGTIQVFFFDNGSYKTELVTEDNYRGFVAEWAKKHDMGGTNYTPVIKDIVRFAEKNGMTKPGKPPVLVLFVTDGEPSDRAQTIQDLKDLSGQPIFWQFIGLGYAPAFLEQLNTMPGRVVDNVGLTEMEQTRDMPDEAWFDEVLKEFLQDWFPAARKAGIVTV